MNEAVEVIKAELQTCMFVERFEFFQKLVVLNFWLCAATEDPVARVRELVQMHLPNLRDSESAPMLRDYQNELEAIFSARSNPITRANCPEIAHEKR